MTNAASASISLERLVSVFLPFLGGGDLAALMFSFLFLEAAGGSSVSSLSWLLANLHLQFSHFSYLSFEVSDSCLPSTQTCLPLTFLGFAGSSMPGKKSSKKSSLITGGLFMVMNLMASNP